MTATALIPWLDPSNLIDGFGAFAIIGVCFIVFAETGLLIGFLLPGDTLLVITGLLTFQGIIGLDIWWVALAIGFAAFVGGEVGYLIGNKFGPRVFERKESGIFSRKNVERTNAFFVRFGALAVVLARFVPIVRTFAPVAVASFGVIVVMMRHGNVTDRLARDRVRRSDASVDGPDGVIRQAQLQGRPGEPGLGQRRC